MKLRDKIHTDEKFFMLYDINVRGSPQDYTRVSKTLAIYSFHTVLLNN